MFYGLISMFYGLISMFYEWCHFDCFLEGAFLEGACVHKEAYLAYVFVHRV